VRDAHIALRAAQVVGAPWWAHLKFTRINIDVITTSTSNRSA
jgi:hypothetical protein